MLQYLADASGVDIQVEWKFVRDVAPPDKKISLKRYNVSVNEAIREVLRQSSNDDARLLAIHIEPGTVTVSLSDQLNKELVMRVYDVRDLIAAALNPMTALRTWKGPPTTLPSTGLLDGRSDPRHGLEWMDFVTSPQEAQEELIRNIKQEINPNSWREFGGTATVRMIAGKLIVIQTRQNQDDIAIWLDTMRQVLR